MGCKDKYNTILDLSEVLFAKFEDFGDWYKILITFKRGIKLDLVYSTLTEATQDYNIILKYITREW